MNVSFIVPTRNEEKIVEKNLLFIHKLISDSGVVSKFEIIVSDYSTDSTPQEVKDLGKKHRNIHYVRATRRGIGAGLKLGVKKSKYSVVVFYPVDLAYDSKGMLNMVHHVSSEKVDLVFGSRRCKGAKEEKSVERQVFSGLYSILINFFFNVRIRDTQGVFAFNKEKMGEVLKAANADDGFYQTELAIYGRKHRVKIQEVPVHQKEPEGRASNINPLKEGWSMFKKIVKKFIEIKF